MLKLNKKLKTTIHDINLSRKMIKEIKKFFFDDWETKNQTTNAQNFIQVEKLTTMAERIEHNFWGAVYMKSNKLLVKKLNEVIEFCERTGVEYVWTVD